jgi:hypothetical protein
MENFINNILDSLNWKISNESSRYSLEEYSKLINNAYIQDDIFNSIEPVLSFEELKQYFDDPISQIYIIEGMEIILC